MPNQLIFESMRNELGGYGYLTNNRNGALEMRILLETYSHNSQRRTDVI